MATLLCGALLAQRGPGFGPRAASGTAPSAADRIAHKVERLTAELSLTSSQASQITTILTNADTASTSARSTLDTDQSALEAAIKSNASGTIDQLSSAIGVLQGQLLAIRSKADGQIYALLTTDQQAKYHLGGGPGGPGGRGPGGPRGPRP